jgi:hypothetical protein
MAQHPAQSAAALAAAAAARDTDPYRASRGLPSGAGPQLTAAPPLSPQTLPPMLPPTLPQTPSRVSRADDESLSFAASRNEVGRF